MEGKDSDEKIEKAILVALSGGIAAEVILPPGHLSIKKPIRLWRTRKNRKEDTTADGAELADIVQLWAAVKNGRPQHLAKGLTLRGSTAGDENLLGRRA